MRIFNVCLFVLATIAVPAKMMAADAKVSGENSFNGASRLAVSDKSSTKLSSVLPKGIQRLEGGGIKILRGSNIKVEKISKSKVRLSGGVLKAADKLAGCAGCRGGGSCSISIVKILGDVPAVRCVGTCDDCTMVTVDKADFKAKDMEDGFSQSDREDCLKIEYLEPTIAASN